MGSKRVVGSIPPVNKNAAKKDTEVNNSSFRS
jgi:hypothetical protein